MVLLFSIDSDLLKLTLFVGISILWAQCPSHLQVLGEMMLISTSISKISWKCLSVCPSVRLSVCLSEKYRVLALALGFFRL